MKIVYISMSIVILSISFILIDGISTKKESFSGKIIDKHYKSEENSTGVGYGMTTSGKSGVVVTSQHEDEKFLIIVKTKGGEIVTVESIPELYYKKKIGQQIKCAHNKGCFTGLIWSSVGVK